MEHSLEFRAYEFAEEKHRGQKRKYNDSPYINHPVAVALKAISTPHCFVGMEGYIIAAAFLHDTVEDCGVKIQEIEDLFGKEVADIVQGLTQYSKQNPMLKDLPRTERHKADLIYLAGQPDVVKYLKGIDRYCNLVDTNLADAQCVSFLRKRYLKESQDIRDLLLQSRDYIVQMLAYELDGIIHKLAGQVDWDKYEAIS